jgi:hypothetical protein
MAENETEKKAKTPAKPRAKKVAVSQAESTTVKKTATKRTSAKKSSAQTIAPSHAKIAERAYWFWIERGRTHGHAFEDWLRAEQELSKA